MMTCGQPGRPYASGGEGGSRYQRCRPTLLEEHVDHERAQAALTRTDCSIGHVVFESYSVLTRLPGRMRVSPNAAAQAIERALPQPVLGSDGLQPGALEELAGVDISAGATYDGLIALTAREHGVRVLSRDRRAIRTFAALGVSYELL